MNRTHHHATSCACRIVRNSLRGRVVPRLVLLTSSEDVREVRKVVGSELPEGSTCTGSVWRVPDGRIISVKRYEDAVPPYQGSVGVAVCNGGKVLTKVEMENVKRWREASTQPLSFVGAERKSVSNTGPIQPPH